MPKPRQQRGRRVKRKPEDEPEDDAHAQNSKRRKSEADEDAADEQDAPSHNGYDEDNLSAAYPPVERAFFGVLDESEQEYFKHADEMLEMDSFANPEERKLFLENVHREADGKELKIVQSQSCSRLMERLIAQSTAPQLKHLFQQLSGNFIHLITHRFASHCCEALFTQAAPVVTQELAHPPKLTNGDPNEVYVSMENLFLHTLAEFEGNLGFLLTDQYASHALRILLLVFSGQTASADSMKNLLQSKRKENVISGLDKEKKQGAGEGDAQPHPVPESFSKALEKLLTESVAGLDTAKLRALSTHPNANPTLQLLLKLELTHYGKQRAKEESSIIKTLLPDDPFTPDCESAAFISGLAYDPVGAHLVERIIENAPAKLFKSLYHTFFKERLVTYARDEVATHIDCRIIERLGYDDLLEAHEELVPLISALLEKSWTTLVRTLIERCTVRKIDTQAIAVQIDQTWQTPDRFDIERMLLLKDQQSTSGQGLQANTNGGNAVSDPSVQASDSGAKTRMNILAQAMLIVPGSLSALILDSLIALEPDVLVAMAKDHITARTLQQALTTQNASIIERRKLVQRFYGTIGDMALDKSASHVVDCIWEGTHGLAFIRERIAEELAENEPALRESAGGRAVWRNWKMDLYKRKRGDWIKQSKAKASNDGFQSFSELDAKKDGAKMDGPRKTPLELARERHAQKKSKENQPNGRVMRSADGPAQPGAAVASASA